MFSHCTHSHFTRTWTLFMPFAIMKWKCFIYISWDMCVQNCSTIFQGDNLKSPHSLFDEIEAIFIQGYLKTKNILPISVIRKVDLNILQNKCRWIGTTRAKECFWLFLTSEKLKAKRIKGQFWWTKILHTYIFILGYPSKHPVHYCCTWT